MIEKITEVAQKIKINNENLECFGHFKAKINPVNIPEKMKGKLILVTSIHPTPYGEGKTTLAIGINDALRHLGKESIAVLREPSMGPVFGIKGGATGGGKSQIIPSEDINLHFTGDMHAITSANNLLCSLIDNHIFQGNKLNIDPQSICFHRCLDVNDRALRHVKLNNREEKFTITAASEIMAILCLTENLDDLKKRLGDILVGYTYDKKPIFARDLKCVDSLAILLKDALKPNLVQSLENNPVIVHGGPFANIAHGCSSLISLKMALSLQDYVITEAGFGADLGAEKFFDIVCRHNITPDLVILNVTLRALKHNGLCPKEEITTPSLDYLKKGIVNLEAHINNLKKFTSHILVVLNHFEEDTLEEIQFIKDFLEKKQMPFEISKAYKEGSKGASEVAKKIIALTDKEKDFHFLYDLNSPLTKKIETICQEIYHAKHIVYSDETLLKIKKLTELNLDKLPICIAKTQYSFSDDKTKLGNPTDYTINVCNIELKNGAGFIVVFLGNIVDMPGLPKNPNALLMTIDNSLQIKGII